MLIDLHSANRKYNQQKNQAKIRGVEFNISFEDWMKVWLDSGHWNQRGKTRGSYNMSRINDTGPYQYDNVFIQSHEQNASDGHKGKEHSELHRMRNSIGVKNWHARNKEAAAWQQN